VNRLVASAVLLCACSSKAEQRPIERVELPEVQDGFVPATNDRDSTLVVMTLDGISIGDNQVVAMKAGRVVGAEKEGGELGVLIPKVREALSVDESAERPPLQLAVDKRLSYRMLVEVMFSAEQAGYRQAGMLARSRGQLVQAPLQHRASDTRCAIVDVLTGTGSAEPIPEPVRVKAAQYRPVDGPPACPDSMPTSAAPPLMFVSIGQSEVVLWSSSGLEGTYTAPKLRVPHQGAPAAIRAALVEIAERRWPRGTPRTDEAITLQAIGDTSIRYIAEMVAAVRATEDGKPLFPEVIYSPGFE
jgi:hypothetical protein